jgi:hypothetical protein
MKTKEEIWAALAAPFPAEDIEWRIAERGQKNNRQWAKVLAYVTNRAIMQRLDEVMGPENWKNEFCHIDSAFLCGLSLRIDNEWITKWDGAQESQIESTKGGISGAMKRAAVQWGIGRYLYNLESGWANIHAGGKNYAGHDQKKNLDAMKWDPPQLPAWALPKGSKPNGFITRDQLADVEALIAETGADKEKFCEWLDVKTLADIPTQHYSKAVKALEAKRNAA